MILEIDKCCSDKDFFFSYREQIENKLIKIMQECIEIEYVWKVVIASDVHYSKIVKEQAWYLNTGGNTSENALAKTIIGEYRGKVTQIIIVRESIFYFFVYSFIYGIKTKNKDINKMIVLSYKTIYHECGHLKEQINSLKMGKQITLMKEKYDLGTFDGLTEFINIQSFAMWGEYYAECFAHKIMKKKNIHMEMSLLKEINDLEQKALEYIEILENYDNIRNAQVKKYEKAYDVLYMYVHYIAYFHIINNKNKKINNIKDKELMKTLNKIGRELKKTYIKYENKNITLKQLEKICEDIYLMIIDIKKVKKNKPRLFTAQS